MAIIHVKILGTRKPQRYAVRRAVLAAQNSLLDAHPGLEVEITDVKDSQEIMRFTPIISYPSLLINDQMVCVGRFPKKEDILTWFHQALQK